MDFLQGRSRANWKTLRCYACDLRRITIAAFFAAALTVSGSAQEFITDAGAPAVVFPNPDRPVANIVAPIWHDERERDAAGEPRQLVRLLGIKSGMTVADVGAGSGYYVAWLSRIVGPHGHVIAEDVVPEYLRGLRRRLRDLRHERTLQLVSVNRTIRGYQLIRSTLRFWCTCITRSRSPTPCSTISSPPSSLARVSHAIDAFRLTSEHGTPPSLLRCELAAVGYREISLDRLTGSDAYLAIFAPPSVASRTRPEAMVACKTPQ